MTISHELQSSGVAPRSEAGDDPAASVLERLPEAFAVTEGPLHTLAYVNSAFRAGVASHGELTLGDPITEAFEAEDAARFAAVLDRVLKTGVVARDRFLGSADIPSRAFSCTVWPRLDAHGAALGLVIELRHACEDDMSLSLQREVAEQMLLGALHSQEMADIAEEGRRDATYLADESRKLDASLDEGATLAAMTGLALRHLGAWCIVDILEPQDGMHRLAIVHPDADKQALARELHEHWLPHPGDRFGLPAMLQDPAPLVVPDGPAAVEQVVEDPDVLRLLRRIAVGSLLTVPIVNQGRLVGAITFVAARGDGPHTATDVALATSLATHSAVALDRARLHSEAVTLRKEAEAANEAKSRFLASLSHELRTPLHAIGGYVDLLELGSRGSLTKEQLTDLRRIRASQLHLTGLIEDLLNFTKLNGGEVGLDLSDVDVCDALTTSVLLVAPLMAQKQLVFDGVACGPEVRAKADGEKLNQILVNLLSNAIKFTPPGGHISIDCERTEHAVAVRVGDSGIGIPPDKLDAIFDPFVQVKTTLASKDSGVGLGLSISRGLARAMHGDVTVESTLGAGAQFTLTLPPAP